MATQKTKTTPKPKKAKQPARDEVVSGQGDDSAESGEAVSGKGGDSAESSEAVSGQGDDSAESGEAVSGKGGDSAESSEAVSGKGEGTLSMETPDNGESLSLESFIESDSIFNQLQSKTANDILLIFVNIGDDSEFTTYAQEIDIKSISQVNIENTAKMCIKALNKHSETIDLCAEVDKLANDLKYDISNGCYSK